MLYGDAGRRQLFALGYLYIDSVYFRRTDEPGGSTATRPLAHHPQYLPRQVVRDDGKYVYRREEEGEGGLSVGDYRTPPAAWARTAYQPTASYAWSNDSPARWVGWREHISRRLS